MTGGGGNEGGQAEAEVPDRPHPRAEAEDAVGVGRAEFIRETLGRGAELLGRFDQADDLLQRAFAGGPEDAAFEEAVEVERAREEVVAGGFRDRAGFAGEVGFVAGALAPGDAQVGGDLPAAGDAHGQAGAEVRDGGLDFQARVVQDGRHLRRASQERADLLLGAALGVVLHRPGGTEEEEEQRALVPRADGGSPDGDPRA